MRLNSQQRRNAATIVAVGRRMGAGTRGIQIALMAALMESNLRNVGYGDRDSVGLFQQRNSWGSRATRMNPASSARLFYSALLRVRGWQRMDLGAAAQRVQKSAHGDWYNRYRATAAALAGGGGLGGGGGWVRPVGGRITTPYGASGSHWKSGHHTGVDFRAPMGTRVRAVADGTVVRIGHGGAYGNSISINHGGKIYTMYAHLSRVGVHVGQHVSGGAFIGLSGASGNTTGAHLHFEVRKGADQYANTINPGPYLSGAMSTTGYASVGDTETTTTEPLNLDPTQYEQVSQQAQLYAPYAYVNPGDVYGGGDDTSVLAAARTPTLAKQKPVMDSGQQG